MSPHRLTSFSSLFLFFVFSILSITTVVVAQPIGASIDSQQVDGLSLPAQYAISQRIGADDARFYPEIRNDEFIFSNQNIVASFNEDGITFEQDDHHWTMVFDGVGYGEQLSAPALPIIQSKDNGIEFVRGDVTEWYFNSYMGIQQGFTLHRRPITLSNLLTLQLGLGGSLTPVLQENQLHLLDADGNTVMTYGGLVAFDATGRIFSSEMVLHENKLLLRVNDQGAVYPLTVDPIVQGGKLSASDGASGDQFAYSLSISGDVVVVGAHADESNRGSVYVYQKSGANWANMTETAKLTASDGVADDHFGFSVSISGDVIVVGAWGDDDSGSMSGSAYVFEKPGANWTSMTQTAKLNTTDAVPNDQFGRSVSISGDVILVGAHGDNNYTGSAYIFQKPGTNWTSMTQTAKLTAADGSINDWFGVSASISGDVVAIGAEYDDVNSADTGSAYVFVKPGDNWEDMTHTAKLSASDGMTNDHFGRSIHNQGDVVVVGAYGSNPGGAVYVFEKPGETWTTMTAQTAKLTASDTATADQLGYSVRISGNLIVAGAKGDDAARGSTYVYKQPGAQWSNLAAETFKLLSSESVTGDEFSRC